MRVLGALMVLMSATVGAAPVRLKVVGDTCPLAAQLQRASGLTVVESGQDFDAMLEREGDEWRVLLKAPDGAVALRRTLSGAKLCADVTFAAQLILERFARELDVKVAVPGPVPIEPKKPVPTPPIPPKPVDVPAPPPLPPPPPKPEPEPDSPPPPPPPPPPLVLFVPPAAPTTPAYPGPVGSRGRGIRLSRLELTAGGAGWFASGVRPAFSAELAVYVSEVLRISGQFAFTTRETSLIHGSGGGAIGTFTTQPFLAGGTVGYCRTFGLRGCASVVVGAHLESGTIAGDYIYTQRNAWLTLPAVGLELQLAWLPIQQLTVALSGTALVLPTQGTWTITGTAFTQTLPGFEGLLRLSIGFGANR